MCKSEIEYNTCNNTKCVSLKVFFFLKKIRNTIKISNKTRKKIMKNTGKNFEFENFLKFFSCTCHLVSPMCHLVPPCVYIMLGRIFIVWFF